MHRPPATNRRPARAAAFAFPLVPLVLAACGAPSAGTTPGPSPGAEPAAAEPWTGDCPHDDSSTTAHVAIVELSASERDPALLADRLARLRHLAQQAADCEAPFTVHLLTGSRSDRIYDTVFDSPLGTETARDRQVEVMADEAMAAVTPALEAAAGTGAAPDDGAGSDPGAAYRVLADELARLAPDAGIDALVLSDGVTVTAAVDLNQSLDGADLDQLATEVAPAVDLGGRVAVDWPAVGHTADPAAPPGPWLDALRSLWQRVCERRNAASCTVTTI